MATYVVQLQCTLNDGMGDGPASEKVVAWVDVAGITVSARTHRRTVLEKAVKAMDEPLEGARYMRVIPESHATPLKVEMEQPPPQLRIGT